MKTNESIRKMVLAALFAALTFVATLIHVHVPGVQTGYVNFGDSLVIISAVLLGPFYGGLAAAIGSALTDALHGLFIYVPATFVIKYIMALAVHIIYRLFVKNSDKIKTFPLVLSGIIAEAIMIAGYFTYEGLFIVTFAGAALGIPGNCLQAFFGIACSVVLLKVLKKTKITDMI